MAREANGAVIFDMDGVMVYTALQHFAAWRQVFAEMGRELSEEEFRATFGWRNQEVLQHMLGDRVSEVQVEELGRRKEEYYRALLRGGVEATPGFMRLLTALRDNGFKIAVGTSAPRQNVGLILDVLSIREQLDAVVTGEDVDRGKPDPKTFLLAAQRCNVEPRRCLVFEDAAAGIQAAKAAGMRCIGVGRMDMAQADLTVDSLTKVTIQVIRSLLD
ncbi:MAG: beta-phosphoglucomutase family hydrolase [Anaerolineae bacterium]